MERIAVDYGCGIGAVSVALLRAGFDRVIGVDIVPQPHYPRLDGLEFVQADMRDLPPARLGAHFSWWSAPCQRWSKMCRCRPELQEKYPDLVTPVRPLLRWSGVPFVMENVEGCPLHDPVMLCSRMYDRELYRHRLFEAGNGISLRRPPHDKRLLHDKPASKAGHWTPGTVMSIAGHVAPIELARDLMGIDWYVPRESLVEAVPVYMAQDIGEQVLDQLAREVAA